jgi:hypothetical protein
MNILVDVGNTSIKWQFRQDQKVVGTEVGDLNSSRRSLRYATTCLLPRQQSHVFAMRCLRANYRRCLQRWAVRQCILLAVLRSLQG